MLGLRLTYLAMLLACASCASSRYENAQRNAQPRSASHEHWVLQPECSDEFNETQLDFGKWNNDVADWGVWSWEPENAWVQNGSLHLRMEYHKHQRATNTLFYTSGIIKSRATPIKYGYFEARVKAAPRFPGVCPAFWAYRHEKGLWTEIDFVELTEQQNVEAVDTNTHVFKHPELPEGKTVHESRSWKSPWDPRDGFHVYGCEWNDKEIRWYVDTKLVATRQNEYWHQALDVVLSFGIRSPLKTKPSDTGFPTVFQVDYIRTWKKAVPKNPDASDGS